MVARSEHGFEALRFAVAARGFTAMADLVAALHRAIARVGMTAAAGGVVSGPKAASPQPFYFADWPPSWLAHYLTQKFLLTDPIPRWARNSGRPLTWSELFEVLPARDPGRKVMAAAAHFGYREGMVVPMRAGDNSFGLVAFAGARDALTLIEQAFLATVARAAFEAAERIEQGGMTGRAAPILSAREIECLVLLVRGHSDRQIAQLLGISEPTVRFHLGNARDKSGAVSRTHLAALAVARGYVTM